MTLENINQTAIRRVTSLHAKTTDFIFLSGSFVKGNFSPLSDLDYTACINEPINHPRFYFTVIDHEGTLRMMSIYFYERHELMKPIEDIDDAYYLWEKDMMPNSKFISGDKESYDNLVLFCKNLIYTRPVKKKTIHKSFGKLFDLLVKLKKYLIAENELLLKYYGSKLAEHVRRLVAEYNGPIHLKGESEYVEAHLAMDGPASFKKSYSDLAGYSFTVLTPKKYYEKAFNLVIDTIDFIHTVPQSDVDDFSLELLQNKNLEELLKELALK